MRLSLILSACIVLCGALIAQADLVDVTYGSTTFTGAISYTRTPVTSSLDELDVSISTVAAWGETGYKLQLLEGTFTATPPQGGGAVALNTAEGVASGATRGVSTPYDPEGVGDWIYYTGSTYANSDLIPHQYSYANFPANDASGAVWNEDLTSMEGSWYTSSNLKKLGDGGLVAKMYVATGDGLNFVGTSSWGGWGFSNSANVHGNFSIPGALSPEPSTLLLAMGGLVGLLCYARRKRR